VFQRNTEKRKNVILELQHAKAVCKTDEDFLMTSKASRKSGLRSRSRKESEVFGSGRIPVNNRSRSRIFDVWLQLRKSTKIIFYIALPSQES